MNSIGYFLVGVACLACMLAGVQTAGAQETERDSDRRIIRRPLIVRPAVIVRPNVIVVR